MKYLLMMFSTNRKITRIKFNNINLYVRNQLIYPLNLDKEIVIYGSPYAFRSLHDELVHFTKLMGHLLILMMRK